MTLGNWPYPTLSFQKIFRLSCMVACILGLGVPLNALTWRLKEHPDLQTWPQPSALFQLQEKASVLPEERLFAKWSLLPPYQFPSWIPLEKFLQDWTPPANAILIGSGFIFLPSNIPLEQKPFFESLLQFLRMQKPAYGEAPQERELEIISYQFSVGTLPARPQFHLTHAFWRKGCLTGPLELSYDDETASEFNSDQVNTRTQVHLSVQSQIPIAVMLDARPQGSEIHAWDWSWQWHSVDHLPWDYVTPEKWRFATGIKFQALHDLSPGEILIPGQNIKEIKPVNQGDVVLLKITHGAIEVDLPGTALESGTEGSPVRVLSTTGQEFHGIVDGKNLVRVTWP